MSKSIAYSVLSNNEALIERIDKLVTYPDSTVRTMTLNEMLGDMTVHHVDNASVEAHGAAMTELKIKYLKGLRAIVLKINAETKKLV